MYNVLDVARHIINYSDEQNYNMSNLKLQKILYLTQAYFLCFVEDGSPLFKENIEAWSFGPVVPEVYREYKQFGGTNIPRINYHYVLDADGIDWSLTKVPFEDIVSDKDKKYIDTVVDTFARYSAASLVRLTHGQTPWKQAYAEGANTVISHQSIREYFKK